MSFRSKMKSIVYGNRFLTVLFKLFRNMFALGLVLTTKKIIHKLKVIFSKTDVYDVRYISRKRLKQQRETQFNHPIKISILVPLYNTPVSFLKEMIESVIAQTYGGWQLCLGDASDTQHSYVGELCRKYASQHPNISYQKLEKNEGIAQNTNECLRMATGDYIALLDHDDLLAQSALYEVVKSVNEYGSDFVYTDEALFAGSIRNVANYHYKPDFSPDMLRSCNYICHLIAFQRELMEQVGEFRPACNGSQDYDMILRLTEIARNIHHVPLPLYFWRLHEGSVSAGTDAKPYTLEAAKRALSDHLERVGLQGKVLDGRVSSTYQIDYEIKGEPLVSILIPNKDHIRDLDLCLTSIFTKTTYSNYEIVIVENNSEEQKTFSYYDKIEQEHPNVTVKRYDGIFNFSKINNFGAKYCSGEHILLLNNDVEVISGNWLKELLMFSQRDTVGAVGAMLYYPNDTVQHAGVIVGLGGVAGHSHKQFMRGENGYMFRLAIAQNLSSCTAACLMMKKKIFEQAGGFDESFAVAFNDVDLCLKIRELDKLVVFTPFAELYHHESISRGFEDTPEKVKRFRGEMKRFTEKWNGFLAQGDPYYNPNLTLDRENFSMR